MISEAEEAARAFGGSDPRLIKERENAVYELRVPPGRAALRLHRSGYQSEAAIRSELWWCQALAEKGLPVPRPLTTLQGNLLARLESGRLASAVGWVEGEPMGAGDVPLSGTQRDQTDLHRSLGRLLARVHATTDALQLPEDFARPRWDIPGLLGEAPFWGRFWDHPALTADEVEVMRQARAFLQARLEAHLSAGGDFGLIHADVLRENVFVGRGAVTLIDFDDSGFGFRLYDLGTVLFQNLSEPYLTEIAAALSEGYGETRSHDAQMIPVFALMRCCASVGWAMPRFAPDHPLHRIRIERATGLARRLLDGGGLR